MNLPINRYDAVIDEEHGRLERSYRRPVWSPGFSRSGPPEGGAVPFMDGAAGWPSRGFECTLHEPGTCLRLGRKFLTPTLNLTLKSKTDSKFMVSRHGIKVVGPLHEPPPLPRFGRGRGWPKAGRGGFGRAHGRNRFEKTNGGFP